MRILYLAHRLPYPPDDGARLRIWHHLRHLSAAHAVDLLAFSDRDVDGRGRDALLGVCRRVELVPLRALTALARGLAAWAGGGALSDGYFGGAAMQRAVRCATAAERYDVAWASSSAIAQHLAAVPAGRVADFVDVDSDKWHQYAAWSRPPAAWAYQLEAARLAGCEARVARTADRVLVISDIEAARLRGSLPHAPLHVVPNGVDTDAVRPPSGGGGARRGLVFVGALDYRPNVDAVAFFTRAVLPRLRARRPELVLTAVGHRPSAALRRLARRADGGLQLTGSVPDVQPYLHAALLCVVPLRFGVGVKNKVLEAMAAGLPVVATPAALHGLPVRSGVEVVVADGAAALAEAVESLFDDDDRRRTLAVAARRRVEASCRWPHVLTALDRCLETLPRRDR